MRPGVPESLHSPTPVHCFHSSYSYLRVLAKAGTQATWPSTSAFFSSSRVKVTPYPSLPLDSLSPGIFFLLLWSSPRPFRARSSDPSLHSACTENMPPKVQKHFCPQVTPCPHSCSSRGRLAQPAGVCPSWGLFGISLSHPLPFAQTRK